MSKTIVVCGHGPGISDAVARKFGREGFQVAIVARSKERLEQAAKALTSAGIKAQAFPCDLGNPEAVDEMLQQVRGSLGSITVLHWNAYTGGAGDLVTAPLEELRRVVDVGVFGLISSVQDAMPDLKANAGAVLVTNGGFGFFDPRADEAGVKFGAMGLSVANSARHKVVRLLNLRLAREGVYVGEVMINGMVKGTAFDNGHATLEPSAIADRFWELYQKRSELSVVFG
jgi:NAD(P)-dependent dehydrogenase (short-subunit alcohol dehydrogenase family)